MSKVAQKVQVMFKGRMICASFLKDIIYEVEKYDQKTGCLVVHRVFDQNGILLMKSNVVKKNLKLKVVDRLYTLLSQDEEYEIRKAMFSNKDNKVTINCPPKYDSMTTKKHSTTK